MAPFDLQRVLPEASLSQREKNKVRKPIVEKMRRDRINSSIEQLKVLLQRHVKPQQKLEKADVLEMAVRFLRQRVKSSGDLEHRQGFSQCLEDARRYLAHRNALQSSEPGAFERFQRTTLSRATQEKLPTSAPVSLKQSAPISQGTLWRPW